MRLTILTTGGTIDKTYDEFQGSLRNRHTVIDVILDSLRLPDLDIAHVEVMHKDSLDMTEEDREVIAEAVRSAAPTSDAMVISWSRDAPISRYRSSSPAPCAPTSFATPMRCRT
jgi:L-asparaginase